MYICISIYTLTNFRSFFQVFQNVNCARLYYNVFDRIYTME